MIIFSIISESFKSTKIEILIEDIIIEMINMIKIHLNDKTPNVNKQ